ncbi:MDR family MFS transporter [Streptomyces sp. NPDC003247]|uniref:MDR family MFS transporter n=1 Tax=Streptomyces sp. NPDC003247 TaxID=3364677 RepID=UPI0036C7B2EF
MSAVTDPSPVTAATRRRPTLLLIAVLGGMLLALLDQTIVSTALPRIAADLPGTAPYGWVVTAYLLGITVTGPLYGRLSDRYGRKRLLLIGIGIFLLGSALCGCARTMAQLIACRGVQGLGAGALMPLSLALATELFPPGRRGRVQGALGGVMALSYVAGPFAGGMLTDHATWRWIFLVNLPIGAAVVVLIAALLPGRPPPGQPVRPDYLGILTFTTAVSALLIGLTEKGGAGRTPWTDHRVWVPLALAAVMTVVCLRVESRAAEPLIPLHLFRNRTYTVISIASAGSAFALYSSVVYLPRYFQTARDADATASGLRIYPLFLGIVAGSMLAGAVIGRTGRYRLVFLGAGLLLGAGAYLFTQVTTDTGTGALATWMLLLGLGLGPALSGLTLAIQDAVPPAHLGTATGNLGFFRQVGGALTLALADTVYAGVAHHDLARHGVRATSALATAAVVPRLAAVGAAALVLTAVFIPAHRPPARGRTPAPSG